MDVQRADLGVRASTTRRASAAAGVLGAARPGCCRRGSCVTVPKKAGERGKGGGVWLTRGAHMAVKEVGGWW
jgi:hypothetical protein